MPFPLQRSKSPAGPSNSSRVQRRRNLLRHRTFIGWVQALPIFPTTTPRRVAPLRTPGWLIPPAERSLLLRVPGHLDVLENLLVGSLGLVAEFGQLADHLVQFREAQLQGVLIRKCIHQSPGDVFGISPRQFHDVAEDALGCFQTEGGARKIQVTTRDGPKRRYWAAPPVSS